MYLLRDKWSRRETLLVAFSVTLVPWGTVLTLIHFLSQNKLSLEIGLVSSGFLALFFTVLLALTLFLLHLKIPVPDFSFFLRKILLVALIVSPLSLLATVLAANLFPLSLLLVIFGQTAILYHYLPLWQQRTVEETVRLEPVFFLTVGIKMVILALFFSYALLI